MQMKVRLHICEGLNGDALTSHFQQRREVETTQSHIYTQSCIKMKKKLTAVYENLQVETDLEKNVPARNFKKVAPTRFLGFTAEIKAQLIM